MIRIFIDADGCPVKNEVFRVALRYSLEAYVVSNSRLRIPQDGLFELVIVDEVTDAADDWIVDHVKEDDIVVSADIPLAARCLDKGARVLDPKGRVFTEESIGSALANRELSAYLRDMGNITGGPAPFEKRDRSRFLQQMDNLIQAAFRAERLRSHHV
ncbi:MAG: YaiI/YqxD family protein [Pseudomonadota bacterium]